MEISMFLDVDCIGGTPSPYFGEEGLLSPQRRYSSSGCLAVPSECGPASYFEFTSQQEFCCQTPRSSVDRSNSSPFGNASSSTSVCWSPSPGAHQIRAGISSSTINPLATMRPDLAIPLSFGPQAAVHLPSTGSPLTTVKPSDLAPHTHGGTIGESISESSAPYASSLDIPITNVTQESPNSEVLFQTPPKSILGWGAKSFPTSRPLVPQRTPAPRQAQSTDSVGASLDCMVHPGTHQRYREPSERPFSHQDEVSNDSVSEDDVDEVDDYRPSRSPSIDYHPAHGDFSSPLKSRKTTARATNTKKNKRTSKRSKGSAALALAVVLEARRHAQTDGPNNLDDQFDPVRVFHETADVAVLPKRKNQSIPLPVPIPNLSKRSRGRKVPFVAKPEDMAAASMGPDGVKHSMVMVESLGNDDDSDYAPKSSRSKRRKVSPPMSSEDGLERSYVCVVAGCGKCFVRGEHLKRHVRSIHTHEKPHVCPYEGCDKSFSRRDNLGQHVRIHLQSL